MSQFVPKGWGYELIHHNTPEYCCKTLHMAKDRCLSYHFHKNKKETFLIMDGEVLLLYANGPAQDNRWIYFDDLNKTPAVINTDKQYESKWETMKNRAHVSCLKVLRKGDIWTIERRFPHALYGNLTSNILECSTFHDDNDSFRLIKGD